MSLLTLKVNKDGYFELRESDYTWRSLSSDSIPWVVGEDIPCEKGWVCEIDTVMQTVTCYVADGDGPLYERTFPLETGTLVLSDINDPHWGGCEDVRMHASFRPTKLQELMDRYSIVAIRNESPNGIYKTLEESVYGWVSDGQIKEDLDTWNTIIGHTVSDASWLLTDVFLFDQNRYARVLYTRKRLTPEMAKSFEECGVNPVA